MAITEEEEGTQTQTTREVEDLIGCFIYNFL
jgi:hypothetical protein